MAWQDASETQQFLFSQLLQNCDSELEMKNWKSQKAISWSSPSTNSSNYSECNSPLSSISQSSQCAVTENDENCRAVAIQTPTSKRIRNVRRSDKHYCAVCGDKPTGYHYDVLSCNGCKTFFRRTIINKRQFKCSKGGKCDFNKDFRCACRACRFQKCILVGMNENAIQFRDKDEADSSMENAAEYFVVPVFKSFIKYEPDKLDGFKALSILVQRESFSQSIRKPGYPIVTNHKLSTILSNPNIIGSNRIKDTSDDKAWRQEVYCQNPIKFWMIADLFLSVEFAKTFNSFRKLTLRDQNILLGEIGGILQIISQSYYSIMAKSDSMVFPDGINALQFRLKNGVQSYEEYYRTVYCKPVAMLRELELNDSEYVFFKTLALFSGDSPEMSEEGRKIIGSARVRVLSYLRDHLIHQHGLPSGVKKFGKIVTALTSFFDVSEKRRTYLEVCHLISRISLSPISKSIFLKQQE
ncbi:unnamed protein product [Auanema sp. JU1783]|nr:unnamed protein product [Auanema sp. JU1783]